MDYFVGGFLVLVLCVVFYVLHSIFFIGKDALKKGEAEAANRKKRITIEIYEEHGIVIVGTRGLESMRGTKSEQTHNIIMAALLKKDIPTGQVENRAVH